MWFRTFQESLTRTKSSFIERDVIGAGKGGVVQLPEMVISAKTP